MPAGSRAVADQRRSYADRLVVKAQRSVELVNVADIHWAEAAGNYVRIHLEYGTVRMRSTFESLLARLDPEVFLRIHRSIVINAGHLRRVSASNGGDATVVLSDGTRLNLSRSHRADVERYLQKLAG
jgi:two-component system LytT family response regulator